MEGPFDVCASGNPKQRTQLTNADRVWICQYKKANSSASCAQIGAEFAKQHSHVSKQPDDTTIGRTIRASAKWLSIPKSNEHKVKNRQTRPAAQQSSQHEVSSLTAAGGADELAAAATPSWSHDDLATAPDAHGGVQQGKLRTDTVSLVFTTLHSHNMCLSGSSCLVTPMTK